MAITEKAIKTLKAPQSGNDVLWDGEIPGFGVRITAAGVKSFVLSYRRNGRKHRYTIGRVSEWSITAARDGKTDRSLFLPSLPAPGARTCRTPGPFVFSHLAKFCRKSPADFERKYPQNPGWIITL